MEESIRREILSKYCSYMELGNHFWDLEDNCRLNNGIDIDILYRNLTDFTNDVASLVEGHWAHNGCTTCMWHNLLTCKIEYDETGALAAAKERFSVPYPRELKENIIHQNLRLLRVNLPSYDGQILIALRRDDRVSVSHRTAAFPESYFDILFSLNEQTHPGEKRLVQLCRQNCALLPASFEENVHRLLGDLYTKSEQVEEDLQTIIRELEKIL